MPAYSGLSRNTLLSIAGPLVQAARLHFTQGGVRDAADEAEAATAALQAVLQRHDQSGTGLRAAVRAAKLEERRVDVRVGGLYRVLLGMAEMGLEGADRALALLYPEGVSAVIRPKGASQRATYEAFGRVLPDAQALPALQRLAPEVEALRTDLEAFLAHGQGQDAQTAARRAEVAAAQAATERLRAALKGLDDAVKAATRGRDDAAYQRWAACLQVGR